MKTFIKILIVISLNLIFIANAFTQSGWVNQTFGTRKYITINYTNSLTGYIASDDKKILKTTNLGLNWTVLNSNILLDATVIDAQFYNDNVYAFLFGGIIFITSNAGLTWNQGNIFPVGNGYVYLYAIDLLNSQTGYVCGADFGIGDYLDGIIYKTTNSGVNWFQSARIGFYYTDIKFIDENTGYATNGSVIKTTNGGINWGYIGSVSYLALSINLPSIDTIYMCGKEGKIHRSINGGVNWTTFQTAGNDTLKDMHFANAKTGYAVGDSGVIVKTTNAGENWTLQFTGTTKNLKSICFINKDTGFVVGDSGIILRTYTGGVMVNVNNESELSPEIYSLEQNYPNPFNPATLIGYNLDVRSFVKLTVYDILGNEVVTLVNKKQEAGRYQVRFEAGITIQSLYLSSGIYFYSMFADGEYIDTKKCLLVK